jgi:DNA replication protein DnaC
MKPFIPCIKCKDSKHPGVIVTEIESTECECLTKYNGYERLWKYLASKGVLSKYIDYDVSEYYGDKSKSSIQGISNLFNAWYKGEVPNFQLYLSGKQSTQKTSVASYFVKDASLHGKSVRYLTMYGLLELLKSKTFDADNEKNWVLDDAKSSDVLFIDDSFDTEKIYFPPKKGFIKSLLLNFLSDRISNIKSNVYISRIKRTDIDSSFGNSVMGILSDNCVEIFLEDVIPSALRNKKLLEIMKEGN